MKKRIVRRCKAGNVIPLKGTCRFCGATAKEPCGKDTATQLPAKEQIAKLQKIPA